MSSRGRGRGGRKRFGDNGFAEWGGYMNAKKSKLEDQFSEAASKEAARTDLGIFHNVAIFVNGYTGN
jgi:DNA repair protein REV1